MKLQDAPAQTAWSAFAGTGHASQPTAPHPTSGVTSWQTLPQSFHSGVHPAAPAAPPAPLPESGLEPPDPPLDPMSMPASAGKPSPSVEPPHASKESATNHDHTDIALRLWANHQPCQAGIVGSDSGQKNQTSGPMNFGPERFTGVAYRDLKSALSHRYESLLEEQRELEQKLASAGVLKERKARVEAELDAVVTQLGTTREKRLPMLSRLLLARPCNANWNEMIGDERVRFCGSCGKDVYNLSVLTGDEAEALIYEREGKLCARFFRRGDGTVLTADCPTGVRQRRRRGALAAAGLAAFAAAGPFAADAFGLGVMGGVELRDRYESARDRYPPPVEEWVPTPRNVYSDSLDSPPTYEALFEEETELDDERQ
jgi:hypothetical protein